MNSYNYAKIEKLDENMRNTEWRKTVVLPGSLSKLVERNGINKLQFGLREIRVNSYINMNSEVLKLSGDILQELGIYEGQELCIKTEGDKIRLGPLVGVFMNENAVGCLKKGNPTVKMLEMQNASKSSGVFVYFFSVDDIVWADNEVRGMVYRPESDTWERRRLPLPDVLYDRGGGFIYESSLKAKYVRGQLRNFPDIRRINDQHYFDKWNLYCDLSNHKEMQEYLPETILYSGRTEDIDQMIRKHGTIYLKMCNGSNGKGVIRVRKRDSSQYEYSFFKDRITEGTVDSLTGLVDIAANLMNDKRFIIQQGIDVIMYQQNKVDMRVLVQRDADGKWQITSMPVRFAVNNCAITSTRSGSKVYTFEEAFLNVLKYEGSRVNNLKAAIFDLIRLSVGAIEKEYGTFGELGIDVAIDKNGKLWFIEANAKPAKDTILIAGPREDINRAFMLPFEYSKYLTEFFSE